MATVKISPEEELRRDIESFDDRIDRCHLHGDIEKARTLMISQCRLIDQLAELESVKLLEQRSVSQPQVRPISWAG